MNPQRNLLTPLETRIDKEPVGETLKSREVKENLRSTVKHLQAPPRISPVDYFFGQIDFT